MSRAFIRKVCLLPSGAPHCLLMKKVVLFIGLVLANASAGFAASEAPVAPLASIVAPALKAGQKAPEFTLPNIDGKKQTLGDFRGKPVAAFFFCGCRLCHKCARAWNEIQRSGTVAEPVSIVIFHGNEEETRLFAEETQLDPKRTVLLADLDEKVTESYQADPCPRVFVLDRDGVVRYTNDEQGADSYKIPAPLIVARTVDALRRVPTAKSAAKVAKPGNKAAKNPSYK